MHVQSSVSSMIIYLNYSSVITFKCTFHVVFDCTYRTSCTKNMVCGIKLKLNSKKLSLWVHWAWQLRVLQKKKYFTRYAGFPFYLQCRNRLTCMNSQRSSYELTEKFIWTHKGVQMNPQRSSNEHTKEFKWTHKELQMTFK